MLLDRIKNIVGKIGDYDKAGFNRIKTSKPKGTKRIFTNSFQNQEQINTI
jgi:hypothetical protein